MSTGVSIYIIAKVTGEPEHECKAKFEKAEALLRKIGFNPINPLKLGIPFNASREEAKPICFKTIAEHAHGIYLLDDWVDSPLGRLEFEHAARLKKYIYFECDQDLLHSDARNFKVLASQPIKKLQHEHL